MEYPLWATTTQPTIQIKVLILLLMEYPLWDTWSLFSSFFGVLILLLMEYPLWGEKGSITITNYKMS